MEQNRKVWNFEILGIELSPSSRELPGGETGKKQNLYGQRACRRDRLAVLSRGEVSMKHTFRNLSLRAALVIDS
jgi:hypothetical protein